MLESRKLCHQWITFNFKSCCSAICWYFNSRCVGNFWWAAHRCGISFVGKRLSKTGDLLVHVCGHIEQWLHTTETKCACKMLSDVIRIEMMLFVPNSFQHTVIIYMGIPPLVIATWWSVQQSPWNFSPSLQVGHHFFGQACVLLTWPPTKK